jgi:hypothetical protein
VATWKKKKKKRNHFLYNLSSRVAQSPTRCRTSHQSAGAAIAVAQGGFVQHAGESQVEIITVMKKSPDFHSAGDVISTGSTRKSIITVKCSSG